MFNPLLNPIQDLTDEQISEAIKKITNRYYMTTNSTIKDSLANLLNQYVDEQSARLLKVDDNTEDFSKYISVN